MANFAIFILQEVDNMLWHSHIKASFDFVWASCLENWSYHC